MILKSLFGMFLGTLNFSPKLSILTFYSPCKIANFFTLSNTCHFSNVRCFFLPFILHRTIPKFKVQKERNKRLDNHTRVVLYKKN